MSGQVRSGQVRSRFSFNQWTLAVELRLTGPGQHWCVYVVYLLPVTRRCCFCCSVPRSLPFSGTAISERERERERERSASRLSAIRRTSSIFQLPGREGGRGSRQTVRETTSSARVWRFGIIALLHYPASISDNITFAATLLLLFLFLQL